MISGRRTAAGRHLRTLFPLGTAGTWKVESWAAIHVLDVRGGIRVKGVRGPHIRRAVDALLAGMGVRATMSPPSY